MINADEAIVLIILNECCGSLGKRETVCLMIVSGFEIGNWQVVLKKKKKEKLSLIILTIFKHSNYKENAK